jgi:hypothetical protein
VELTWRISDISTVTAPSRANIVGGSNYFFYLLDVGTANTLVLYSATLVNGNRMNINNFKCQLVMNFTGERISPILVPAMHELQQTIVDTFVFGVVYLIERNAQDIFVVIQNVSCPYALLDPVVRQRIVLLYVIAWRLVGKLQ